MRLSRRLVSLFETIVAKMKLNKEGTIGSILQFHLYLFLLSDFDCPKVHLLC